MRRYTDAQLVDAVRRSRSWRGVLRELGLSATSASAMRSVRRQADLLTIDYTHFTGQRRWQDHELVEAVGRSRSWTQVAEALGLAGGSSTTTLRGHAARLGLDTSHLARPAAAGPPTPDMQPVMANLAKAASLMAGAWFELCGYSVSWPLEPCSYDLLVWKDGQAERIQVKSTRVRTGDSWTVWLSRTRRQRLPYDPDDIDQFFIIDADLHYYLIPVATVGGLMAIQLSAYQAFRLPAIQPSPWDTSSQ
jgi:hypothetical protein